MQKGKLLGLIFGLMLVFGSPAWAGFVVDDWTLNLTGIDGLGATVINDIGQITFLGITHAQVVESYPTATGVETYSVVDGLLTATSFVNTVGSIINFTGLNNSYQMNFDFSVDSYTANQLANPATFVHLDPRNADGILDIWIDGPTGGITAAENSTGANFQDGVKIASFQIVSGDGGVFSTSTFDGSDDATFSLIWALPNILFDKLGNDLSLLGETLLVYTDSNYDANPQNIDPAGFNIGGAAGMTYAGIQDVWAGNTGFTYTGFGSAFSFYAEEDGSARLAVVPEPSTILLLGAGLLGLGIIGRKRMRK